MKTTILAVGKLRKGPELTLIRDYLDRAAKAGRAIGFGPVTITEIEDKRHLGMAEEAKLLDKAIPEGAVIVTLDERGALISSPELAHRLANWRDNARDVCFIIGGADGIDPELRARADFSLSFGKMVWPHMLVRVMLAEQIYRAGQILSGTPYHRE